MYHTITCRTFNLFAFFKSIIFMYYCIMKLIKFAISLMHRKKPVHFFTLAFETSHIFDCTPVAKIPSTSYILQMKCNMDLNSNGCTSLSKHNSCFATVLILTNVFIPINRAQRPIHFSLKRTTFS